VTTPRVVDAHMHLGCPWTIFAHGWGLAEVLALMDRIGIERAYSTHHAWLAGRHLEARAASVLAYEESRGRIPFLGVYDPRSEQESLAVIDACRSHAGLIGIKVHPSFHRVAANDDSYAAVWDYAGENRLPILAHTWSETDNPVQKLSLPELFEVHLEKRPEVPFIIGHSGGPGAGRLQAIRLARKYPHVYLDLAGDIFALDLIPYLVTAVGAERVIFGSDQPWIDPRAHLTRIYLADIGDRAKRLVLGRNALRVFEPHLLREDEECSP